MRVIAVLAVVLVGACSVTVPPPVDVRGPQQITIVPPGPPVLVK